MKKWKEMQEIRRVDQKWLTFPQCGRSHCPALVGSGPSSEKSKVTGKTQVFIKPVGDSSTNLQRQMQMFWTPQNLPITTKIIYRWPKPAQLFHWLNTDLPQNSVGTPSLTSHLSLAESFLCVVVYWNRKISVKLYKTSVCWNCCETSLWEVYLWPTTYPRGGTHGNSWCGCAARFSKSWPYFRQKKINFPHPFTDQTSKIHTRFQTEPLGILSFQTLRTEQNPYPMGRHIPI